MPINELWAPLVFSRTQFVDFRLLAAPQDVPEDDLDWMRDHIWGSTAHPDDLRNGHRWSLFKSDQYCVFGFTGMASLLSANRTRVNNRDLYVFAGWACQVDVDETGSLSHARVPAVELLESTSFSVIRPLYRYVRQSWDETRTSLQPAEFRSEIEQPYHRVHAIEGLLTTTGQRKKPNDQRLVARQDSVGEETSRLTYAREAKYVAGYSRPPAQAAINCWQEAATSDRPVSLCLGLPDRSIAEQGPYLNALVIDPDSSPAQTTAATEDLSWSDIEGGAQDEATNSVSETNATDDVVPGRFARFVDQLIDRSATGGSKTPTDSRDSDAHIPVLRSTKSMEESDDWIDYGAE